MNCAPSFFAVLGQTFLSSKRARGLGAHGDRHAPRHFIDDDRGNACALVEGHCREIARRAAGEKGGIVGIEAAIDQEAHIGAQCRLIDGQARLIGERRRDRDVAPFQECFQPLALHASPSRLTMPAILRTAARSG